MKHPKYRPSLSAQEIQDCLDALLLTNPDSPAVATLQLFQFKQSLGRVTPTNPRLVQPTPVAETPEQQAEREAKELAEEQKKLDELIKPSKQPGQSGPIDPEEL